MCHRPPHNPDTRPLRIKDIEYIRQIRIRRPSKRFIALCKRSLQRLYNGCLIRSLRRHLRLIGCCRVICRTASLQLCFGHMVHHPSIRSHIRGRLERIVRRRHLVRRLQNIRLHRGIASLHLSRWPRRSTRSRRSLSYRDTRRHHPGHRAHHTNPLHHAHLVHQA